MYVRGSVEQARTSVGFSAVIDQLRKERKRRE